MVFLQFPFWLKLKKKKKKWKQRDKNNNCRDVERKIFEWQTEDKGIIRKLLRGEL